MTDEQTNDKITLDYKTAAAKPRANKSFGRTCTWISFLLLPVVLIAYPSLFLIDSFFRLDQLLMICAYGAALICSAAGFLLAIVAMLFANPQLSVLLAALHLAAPFATFLLFIWIR